MNEDTLDELYNKAVTVVLHSPHGPCVATLQRTLMIGYNRAQRLIEKMCDNGVLIRGDHGYKKP